MTSPTPPSCWALSDAAAGNRRQAEALAQVLDAHFEARCLVLREPWNTFAPRLTLLADRGIRDSAGAPLAPPWPDIAIGCGRRAALATRLLRRWSGGRTLTVQILDPRIDSHAFDVVIAPHHDSITGENVIQSIGALNPVDGSWLAAGRDAFARLGELATPRTAVLIGATNRAQRLDRAYFGGLLERLAAWRAADGGSYLVTVSRRTPRAIAASLRSAFAAFPGAFWAGVDDGANPYAGFLGWADRIVVTPDSVNMISEACATGKPVYTFAPRTIMGKLAAFHRELRASGHLRSIGETSHRPLPPPLAETREIADLVRRRWQAATAVSRTWRHADQ